MTHSVLHASFVLQLMCTTLTLAQVRNDLDSLASEALWYAALNRVDEVNAALYLYTTNRKVPPTSLDDLRQFLEEQSLLTDIIESGIVSLTSDTSGKVILTIDLASLDSIKIGDSFYHIDLGQAEVALGKPLSSGSSARTFSGRVYQTVLNHYSKGSITVPPHDGSIGMVRVDQEGIRKLRKPPTNTQAVGSPEWTVLEYYNALVRADYDRSTDLLEPNDLALLVEVFDRIIRKDSTSALVTSLFNEDESVEQFMRLPPKSRAARILRSGIGRNDQLAVALGAAKLTFIGHVLEGDSLAHVVVRMTVNANGRTFTGVAINSVKKSASRWYTILEDDKRDQIQGLLRRQ